MAGWPTVSEMKIIEQRRRECLCRTCRACEIKGVNFEGCSGCFKPVIEEDACVVCTFKE